MIEASVRPGFGAKAAALALGAAAPWAGFALFGAGASGPVLPILALIVSAGCALGLARLLAPVAQAARELRSLAIEDGADPASFDRADALAAIRIGAAHLSQRVQSLQHRWLWRHPLTGLAVRETLIQSIAEDLGGAVRPGLLGAVRFADFNRLAAFDPATADLALKQFAERLAASLGPGRPLAQVDRDSFAIWFGDAAPDAAEIELKAICYALGAEISAGELVLIPEIEVGTALCPGDAADPAGLVNHALVSLARPGAGRPSAAPGGSAHLARERFAIEQELRLAIGRDQLEMAFQPVIDLGRGVIGAEALLRWRHPDWGMVSPSRFIPIVEDADLIDEIGRWTLNAACRETRRWQSRGLKRLKVAVNLSAAQLRDPELKQTIQRTLERHRLRAGALELELTETAAAKDAGRTLALFRELRALGVSLAIDDFGSGYSSLSYLKNLPFDKLKIDREFVVDVDKRGDSQAICRSLIELARGLGLTILAEGVERWAEVETLQRLGCRIFQGFVFSEPVDSDQFIEIALDPQWRGPVQRPADIGGTEARMSA